MLNLVKQLHVILQKAGSMMAQTSLPACQMFSVLMLSFLSPQQTNTLGGLSFKLLLFSPPFLSPQWPDLVFSVASYLCRKP